MTPLPAICSNGHLYAVGDIVGGAGSILSLKITNSDTSVPCPECGRRGRIVDGTYAVAEGALQILSLADYSVETLREIHRIAGAECPDQGAQLEAVAPGLIAWAQRHAVVMGLGLSAIGTIATVVALILPLLSSEMTSDQMRDAVREGVARGIAESRRTTPSGAPGVAEVDDDVRPVVKRPELEQRSADRAQRQKNQQKRRRVREARRRNR
jgi:hypothetical protein